VFVVEGTRAEERNWQEGGGGGGRRRRKYDGKQLEWRAHSLCCVEESKVLLLEPANL